MEAISEDAGLSTGAIYSNFRGKEDLFLSLYEERIERRRGELRSAAERAGGGRAGVAAANAEVAEAFRRDREWFLLYFEFALHAARDPVFARRFRRVRQAGLRELERDLSDGLEHAWLEPTLPAVQLARGLRALSYGLALERLIDDGRGSGALFGRLAELIFRGLAESKTSKARRAKEADAR